MSTKIHVFMDKEEKTLWLSSYLELCCLISPVSFEDVCFKWLVKTVYTFDLEIFVVTAIYGVLGQERLRS